jgi:hypothetical protein
LNAVDGAALIGEYDASGALLRRYVYGTDGPRPLPTNGSFSLQFG